MLNQSKQSVPLSERRIRYVFSMRIATVVMVFFSASWSLLQWALATEHFFMEEGLTRQFVQFEAMACAVIAACAALHLGANGIAWLVTVIRLRHHTIGVTASRRPMKAPVRRASML